MKIEDMDWQSKLNRKNLDEGANEVLELKISADILGEGFRSY